MWGFVLDLISVLDAVLEALEWADLDDVACWLGLEHGFFAGEWVDALACLGCWLALDHDLHHAWDVEGAAVALLEVLLDHVTHDVEDLSGFFFGDADVVGDDGEDFRLGAWLVLRSDDLCWLLRSWCSLLRRCFLRSGLTCWCLLGGAACSGFLCGFLGGAFFGCFLGHCILHSATK